MDSCEKELKLCKFLLGKNADLINEREQRTIGEIKALVDGTDLSIQNIVSEFKDDFYEFEKNYRKSLEKVFEFIKKEFEFVETSFGINYWLSAKDVLEIRIIDDEDACIFLCACAKALGDDKAEVIIAELENLKTHAFIITQIENDFVILDPTQKHEFNAFYGTKTDIIKKYNFKNQKIKRFLYKFNSQKYEQFLDD